MGLLNDPDDAELLFRKGILHRLQGEPFQAGESWRRILTLRRPEHFASVDDGIYGHLTWRNLAVLAEEQGDTVEAVRLWQAILKVQPGDDHALLSLARLKQPPTL
jgi:tetratricopeptide (TPR) repeat protein